MTWLGIDIGTSSIKAVIVDEKGDVCSEVSVPLDVQRPHSGWSEQHPSAWWAAVQQGVKQLDRDAKRRVRGIGLAGQMHGVCLLDASDQVLRPAILWNDTRAAAQGQAIDATPDSRRITGNAAMPGFSAPKVAWVRENEPAIFDQINKILLPKDYVRLCMSGECATDMADASGTLWLDVGTRQWSQDLLSAGGLHIEQMPHLYEGTQITGLLRADIAAAWGMAQVPIAAGGGDNAAAAVGVGVVTPNQGLVSLGTSGVIFVPTALHLPAPEQGAHAFAHALPDIWHQMAVILSAASALDWVSRACNFASPVAAIEAAQRIEPFSRPELFLPYLSGERTPHNSADARATFAGLDHDSDAGALSAAVLEGVAFALADGLQVLRDAGSNIEALTFIGGGARSKHWAKIVAAAMNTPLNIIGEAHLGPAFGAARLARLAVDGEAIDEVARRAPALETIVPNKDLVGRAREKHARFKALFPATLLN